VIVEESKITEYLLSTTHPIGRSKAAFFVRFGFRSESWQALREALLNHAASAAVVSTVETEFGIKGSGRTNIHTRRPGASHPISMVPSRRSK
jgi:hypothetical protein